MMVSFFVRVNPPNENVEPSRYKVSKLTVVAASCAACAVEYWALEFGVGLTLQTVAETFVKKATSAKIITVVKVFVLIMLILKLLDNI
jgi:hypothetical protein